MATYDIRIFGDPVLKQRSQEVEDIDGRLAKIASAAIDTMYEAGGVGLAAPQFGIQQRFFVYDIGDGPQTLVNPKILEVSDGQAPFEEGCLSIPGLYFEVVRPMKVTISAFDLEGNEVTMEGDEFVARVFQHELDHLDGILILDRIDPDVRKDALRKIREHGLPEERKGHHPL